MALKMKIAAALAALTVTSAASVVAYAERADFNLTARVGLSDVTPKAEAVKKEDEAYAIVNVESGIPSGVHVTFRVREYDGSYATDYVNAYKMNTVYSMNYFDGQGEWGKTYRLATSLNPNQSVTSAVVSGYWIP